MSKKTIAINPDTHAAIKLLAQANDMTIEAFTEHLVEKEMEYQKDGAIKVKFIQPRVVATVGRYGDTHEIKEVTLSCERDIEIFYGRNETGEHVAMLPIKVTYRRKLS
jgi:hypothetical protein